MSLLALSTILIHGLLFTQVEGTIFTSPTQPGLSPSYDFIVIGAGTAGNVLATRLSEDPSVSVLLIEAGVTNEGLLGVEVPQYYTTLAPDTPLTWNYTTIPQPGYNGRNIPYPRGRLLGGSSSINSMIYSRGSQDDFDRLANVTDDQGWSWDAIQPYIFKNEGFVHSADNHNLTGQYNPSVHGTTGPLKVSLSGYSWPTDRLVIETTKELPSQFPFNLDYNGGNNIGIGYVQATINVYERSSSATAYLEGLAGSRSNLHLLIGTTATEIISNSTLHGKVSFNAVKMAQSANGFSTTILAKKEIILSAGAVATPQLLQLSGIGNAATLNNFGIRTLINNTEVGQNLQDHPLVITQWEISDTETLDAPRYNATLAAEQLNQWDTSQDGPLVSPPANLYGYFKLPENEQYPDPSAGPTSGNFELIFSNGFLSFDQPFPPSGYYFSVVNAVVSPESRGSVVLQSASAFDYPLIDPGYFTEPFDMYAMIQSIRTTQQFVSASAWDGFIIGPYGPTANLTTDDEIESFVGNYGGTIFHPVGTAHAGPANTKEGVVDSQLRVKGAAGLRVVDASIFPYIFSVHPQASIYIIAERASDLIKEAWNLT